LTIAMSTSANIAEQEERLVFDRFDEARAFEIGGLIRRRGLAEAMPIVVEIRFWDRLLFYAALPGSTSSNTEWVRRKLNVVKMFHKSTYRMVLEEQRPDRTFKPGAGLSPADFVLAGGGFPIRIKGVGVVGGIGVSGMPEREDHALIVEALCEHLGVDRAKLVLES
jgi:uncharacterized protein (UPF0303 family)